MIDHTGSPSRQAYSVQLEVAGPIAMFARPDTGGTPTSYPVPTWSAATGMFQSIAFFADGAAWICPTKAETCRRVGEAGGRVQMQHYTTNYGGPLRKGGLLSQGAVAGGSSMQISGTVLVDVCYRLHGIVVGPRRPGRINARHHLKDLFDRRLKRGQCFRTPRLGWSECTCSYWGPFRSGMTEVDGSLSLKVPSMLLSVWNQPFGGRYAPIFRQDVRIAAGVMAYDVPQEWLDGADHTEVSSAQ